MTNFLNNIPNLTDTLTHLLFGQNIIEDNKSISMIELFDLFWVEMINIKGKCEALLIIG